MSDTDFCALWTAEFVRDIRAKRLRVSQSLATLKGPPDSGYRQGHELMLRLYDAALAAINTETLGVSA